MKLNIFLPFTEIQPATQIALIGYDYIPVKMEGEYGYSDFFKRRWQDGNSFINVEHDCVPWPGAIEELADCPEKWCAFNYGLPNHRKNPHFGDELAIPLGCTKIGKALIESTPDLWDEPINWLYCDQQLPKTGNKVHQHYPGIVNANRVLIK